MTGAVLFDLDGTLLDTPAGIVATFTAALDQLGLPPAEPEAIRATIGLPIQVAFSRLLGIPADDAWMETGIARYQQCFREVVLPRAPSLVFAGVVEGLTTLRAAGLRLTVATSKFHASADALLAAAGLRPEFELLLGADEVAHPKPHPEMALRTLERLGVPAEAAVMVGDTSHDLAMARSAGLRSVAVTYGVHDRAQLATAEPTWFADTFAETTDHLIRALAPDHPRDHAERIPL